MNARYSVLATSELEPLPTKSVLDTLAEISRKRINNEELSIESVKKTCSEPPLSSISIDVPDRPVLGIKKRQWNNSTTNLSSEKITPESKRDCNRTNIMLTRNNELYSSLSSSISINKRLNQDASSMRGHLLQSKSFTDRQTMQPIHVQPKSKSITCSKIIEPKHENVPLVTPSLSALHRAPISTMSVVPELDSTTEIEKSKREQQPKVMRLFNANYDVRPKEPEKAVDDEDDLGINFVVPKPFNEDIANSTKLNEEKFENRLKMMFSVIRADEDDDDGLNLSKDVVDKGKVLEETRTDLNVQSSILLQNSQSSLSNSNPIMNANLNPPITTTAVIAEEKSSVISTASPTSQTSIVPSRQGGFEFKTPTTSAVSALNFLNDSNLSPILKPSQNSSEVPVQSTPSEKCSTLISSSTGYVASTPAPAKVSVPTLSNVTTSAAPVVPSVSVAPPTYTPVTTTSLNMTFGGVNIPSVISSTKHSQPDTIQPTFNFGTSNASATTSTSSVKSSSNLSPASNLGGFKFGTTTTCSSKTNITPAITESLVANHNVTSVKPIDYKMVSTSIPTSTTSPNFSFGIQSTPQTSFGTSSNMFVTKPTTNEPVSNASAFSTGIEPLKSSTNATSSSVGFGGVNPNHFGSTTNKSAPILPAFGLSGSTTLTFGNSNKTDAQTGFIITTTTQSLTLGTNTTAQSTFKPSFGGSTSTMSMSHQNSNIFGAAMNLPASNTTQQSTLSAFGVQSKSSPSNNVFGSIAPSKSETTPNMFGSPSSNTSVTPNLFGAKSPITNVFGGAAQSESPSSSSFTFKTVQSAPAQPNTDSGMFKFGGGASTVTTQTASNIFGGATPAVTQSNTTGFGMNTSTTQQNSAFAFGSPTPPVHNVAFGGANPPNSGSTFAFGGNGNSTNSTALTFGAPTSAFGSLSANNPPAFGSSNKNAPAFGSLTTTNSPAFGSSNTNNPSAFGSTTAFTPAFGSTTTNNPPSFGATTAPFANSNMSNNSAVTGFGNNPPAFGSMNATQPTFGSVTNNPPIFGSAPSASDSAKPFSFGGPPNTVQSNQNSGNTFNFTNQQSAPTAVPFNFGGASAPASAPANPFSFGPNSVASPGRRPIRTASRRLK